MLIVDLLDRRIGVNPSTAISALPYSEADFPAQFPYQRWTFQLTMYTEYWRWFTGEVWEEKIPGATDKQGDPVLRFPLQVNLVKTAAMKHNYVLFGEVPDGPEPLVPPRVSPKLQPNEDAPTDARKRLAKELELFLNDVWMENNGRVLQLEGGLVQQFLGGVVYKVSYNLSNPDLTNQIKLEMILPDFFLPVWDTTDPDRLLEVFLVWRMPAREAVLKFGIDLVGQYPDYLLYVEHWTKDAISILLGGKPVSYTVEEVDNDGNVIDQTTTVYNRVKNPFGFIPFVYIPRERNGGYYGLSIIEDLKGLSKEINARMTDIGDVIAETSHRVVFIRNAPGNIRTRDIGGLRNVVDLGSKIGSGGDPDAIPIDPPKMADNLVNYGEILRKQFIRDAFISSVAEGEDEGSQRSALTLAFRMWPITSKSRSIRMYWDNGLTRINRMIARIAIAKKIGGITSDHLKGMNIHNEWSPQIPRDREQLVNEVNILLGRQALSPFTALKILGTVQDPSDEMVRVKEWLEYTTKLQSQAQMQIDSNKAKTADKPVNSDAGSTTQTSQDTK